nr:hypothetical protein [Candidatus Sigynarchaeota archaeon]
MAVLISVFDTRMGPVQFITIPANFNESIIKKTTKLMDFFNEKDEFFIQENPEDGVKSLNLAMNVPSEWARGKTEITLLSVITTEEYPNVEQYKKAMVEFKNAFLARPSAYMAFYKGHRQQALLQSLGVDIGTFQADINENYRVLKEMAEILYDHVKIDAPITHAYVSTISDVVASGMQVPKSALNELRELSRSKGGNALFAVFRKIGDMMKVDLIPSSQQVIKVRVIVDELTPEFIMRASHIISLPLLFTTGICQERAGRCSYEA